MALQKDFRFKPEIEFVPELNWWVRWEQDSQDPHSYSAVKLSPAVVEEMQLQGPSVDGDGADGGVDGCTDKELSDLAEVLSMSQQQDGSNEEVAGLAEAVRATQRRRSSRQQQQQQQQTAQPGSSRRPSRLAVSSTGQPSAPSNSNSTAQPQAAGSRWADAKEVKIVVNSNTQKADKRCMKAFMDFLQHQHNITDDPTTFEHDKIKKLVADFITRAKKQDGTDYNRTSLLDTVRGVLRVLNTSYKQLELDGKPRPQALSLKDDTILYTTADSVSRQLSAAGKGQINKQPEFTPAELARLISVCRNLPPSCFRHNMRKYLWLATNWGGRGSEYYIIERSDVLVTIDKDDNPCVRFKVPADIKQNQGGINRSSGVQEMDQNPYVYLYPDPFDSFLDGESILREDDLYRKAAHTSSNKDPCNKLFLQLKQTYSTQQTDAAGKKMKKKFDVTKYVDVNGPLGENRFNWLLQSACELAGLEPRTNHGLRRTFIHACYRAGMPEAAIRLLSRHTSVEGLRIYAGFDDSQFAQFAQIRQQQARNPTGDMAYMVIAANKMPTQQQPLPAKQQPLPAKQQPMPIKRPLPSASSRQQSSSATATAAGTSNKWEDEYVDLDDYEAASPAPKKAARSAAFEPQPPQPTISNPAAQQQPNSLPQGINIHINLPPAGPAAGSIPWAPPPGYVGPDYPHPPHGAYSGGYPPAPYPGAGYGAPGPYAAYGWPSSGWPPSGMAPAGWPPSGMAPAGWPPSGWPPGYPPAPAFHHPGQQQPGLPAASAGLRLRRSALIDEDDD